MNAHIHVLVLLSLFVVSCASGSKDDSQASEPVAGDDNGASGNSATGGTSAAGLGGAGVDVAGQEGEAGRTNNAAGASGSAGEQAAPSSLDADAILRGSCATSTVESTLLPSNLLFVIDRTGTMACNPPPTTASSDCEKTPERADASLPSKWEITIEALLDAMEALPASANVGISYFSNDDGCGVHRNPSVPLAQNTETQRLAMEASLSSITPGGGTPLVGATILAYRHLHDLALAGSITGNEFVVLLSDGEQSEQCSYEPRCTDATSCYELLLDDEVPRAAAPGVGIRTFVIGAPGSEPSRSVLSTIASRGGTAPADCNPELGNCHFDMTLETDFGEALTDALDAIIGEAITCELEIPAPSEDQELDLGLVNVIRTPNGESPVLLRQDTRAPCDEGADGWQYTEDNSKIRLCGPTCDAVMGDEGGRVDVVLGCPVQGPE